jgi:hypothetical protein
MTVLWFPGVCEAPTFAAFSTSSMTRELPLPRSLDAERKLMAGIGK